MKTSLIRFAATTTLAVTALSAFAPFARSAQAGGADLNDWQSNYGVGPTAAGDIDQDGDVDGRDFILWRKNLPPSASNKLFVGGLSWDTSNATAQFNPKEIAVDKSVPWQQ